MRWRWSAAGDEYVIEILVPGLEQSEIVIEADSESLVVRTQRRWIKGC